MKNFFELYQLEPFTEFVETFLTHQGAYAPLLLLLLEEAGVPLPIPGDVVIAYTGYEVSRGTMPYIGAFLLLLMSVLIGSSILYYLSARFGNQIVLKFGHYIHLNEKKLLTVEEKFRKYGVWVIIFGRHIPGFRIPITVFAGMSEMTYKTFIVSTFISVIFWIPFYLALGQNLGPKTMQLLKGHHEYFLIALIPFIIFICSLLYASFNRKKAGNTPKLSHFVSHKVKL